MNRSSPRRPAQKTSRRPASRRTTVRRAAAVPVKPISTDLEAIYRDLILDHYRHPRNFGPMSDATVSRHEANFSCGDDLTLHLRIADGDMVEKASFEGRGCALSLAGASLLTEHIIGKTLAQLQKMTMSEAVALLGVDVTGGRLRCATLAWKALQMAITAHLKP